MPSWAKFIAMDADGTWHCYEFEPMRLRSIWGSVEGREQLSPMQPASVDWRTSLKEI